MLEPPALPPFGCTGTNQQGCEGQCDAHRRGPPSSSRVRAGERAASEPLSCWYALPGATHSRGELIWLHPTTYFASALSFDQGKVARLNTAIILFDKKGSILGSTWAEANIQHAEILRITPECLISHSLGSKCVPDVDAERMIPPSSTFIILSSKPEWRFEFITFG
ncbi:hypothetical protein BKA70DRAFT_1335752 [Coprinopsis sp. MPI-PUGE-AT-0042]|nr:hypothetical protein BKA70DRAFT_1335752 [Coprinopsis sp. MPI-PUGE-AT-0042]